MDQADWLRNGVDLFLRIAGKVKDYIERDKIDLKL